MLRQVVVHQILEVPLIANALPTATATKPRTPAIKRLAEFSTKASFERIGHALPLNRMAPTHKGVNMRRRCTHLVQTPTVGLTDRASRYDESFLHSSVESYRRMFRMTFVKFGHLFVRPLNTLPSPDIALWSVGKPRSIGVKCEQIDRHDGHLSCGCIIHKYVQPAGIHPRLSAERRCLFLAAKESVGKSKRMIVTGRTRLHTNRWALATIMSDGMAGPETGL